MGELRLCQECRAGVFHERLTRSIMRTVKEDACRAERDSGQSRELTNLFKPAFPDRLHDQKSRKQPCLGRGA